jgi:hypothetical protein
MIESEGTALVWRILDRCFESWLRSHNPLEGPFSGLVGPGSHSASRPHYLRLWPIKRATRRKPASGIRAKAKRVRLILGNAVHRNHMSGSRLPADVDLVLLTLFRWPARNTLRAFDGTPCRSDAFVAEP